MSMYIDADELKDWSEIVPLTGDGGIDINDFDEKLASMPTADVAPVRHGKWIGTEYHEWKCSACGRIFEDEEPTWNFCPCCGATMDGERDG